MKTSTTPYDPRPLNEAMPKIFEKLIRLRDAERRNRKKLERVKNIEQHITNKASLPSNSR